MRVRAFHALGREILAGSGADVTWLVDRATILRQIVGHPIPPALLRRCDDTFSRLKLDPEAASLDDAALSEHFARYQTTLRELGALDFDDLVARALALLRQTPRRSVGGARRAAVAARR